MTMSDGMLAEPWHLRGYQENRLRVDLKSSAVSVF